MQDVTTMGVEGGEATRLQYEVMVLPHNGKVNLPHELLDSWGSYGLPSAICGIVIAIAFVGNIFRG